MKRPVPGGFDPARPAAGASVLRPTESAAVTTELDVGVFETVLPSGTRILSERIDSVRSVATGFWFRSGSAHEPRELAGISHLLEHTVFKARHGGRLPRARNRRLVVAGRVYLARTLSRSWSRAWMAG